MDLLKLFGLKDWIVLAAGAALITLVIVAAGAPWITAGGIALACVLVTLASEGHLRRKEKDSR